MAGYEDLVTDEQGRIPGIDNTLIPGKYYLTETAAPEGYEGLKKDIVFTISKLGKIEVEDSNNVGYFDITGDYEFIGIRAKSDAMYLTSIEIEWSGIGTVYTYTQTSIRFGGLLSQQLWNELDTENHIIEGFGVMIATDDVVGKDMEIKDFYESAASSELEPDVSEEIVDYFVPVENLETVMGVQGSNYFWNLRYSVADLKTTYVAAAYIKTTAGYVFFKQAIYSAKTLAQDYLENRDYAAASYGGSLANLANM